MAKATGTAGRAGTTEALVPAGRQPVVDILPVPAPGEGTVTARATQTIPKPSIYEGPTVGPEGQARYRRIVEYDRSLKAGDKVQVRWGYGSGFRARGLGTIVKVNAKSLQVRLDEDVQSPYSREVGWPKGFTLKGIARFGTFGGNWNFWNSVEPR